MMVAQFLRNNMMVIYPQREGKSIEFKEVPPDFGKLIRTCVAFANTSGGDLIIGVTDKTREVDYPWIVLTRSMKTFRMRFTKRCRQLYYLKST